MVAYIFAVGGEPSTMLPPGELVEQLGPTENAQSTTDNTHRTSMQAMKPETVQSLHLNSECGGHGHDGLHFNARS